MFFKKRVSNAVKGNAVYMWNINPNEHKPVPMKNIFKNQEYFHYRIVNRSILENAVHEYADKKLLNLWVKIPWWIVKADLGRLIYVYLNGGFYFDVDCLVKKNFYNEVGESMVLFIEKGLSSTEKLGPREQKTEDRKLRIANYAFGTNHKKHQFIKQCIDECVLRLEIIFKEKLKEISEIDIVWLCGPDVVTSVYHDNKQNFSDIILLEKDYIKHQSFSGWRK